ncbi:MAG: M20 family metallopeptidase [Propionibacteriaceae bacterium]|jgi:acetylornithine deacetylase/succinyl-diaminopimelate desuccinylase family protein|nr:M20 family metallopeptidase [Propionibacteriaceae bacterium]
MSGGVLSFVDDTWTLDLLRSLLRADSQNPPGHEAAAAQVVAEALTGLGLRVRSIEVEPGRPNVVAELPGDDPESLLLNGHLDTVTIGDPDAWHYDPFGEVSAGRCYGRGSCDMKGGLAAMIGAVAAVVHSGMPRRRSLLLTAVIDEEVWFKGTQSLLDDGLLTNCSRAYISEPTSLSIATSLQGAAEFTARIDGVAAHTGMAELGRNAIIGMNHLVAALDSYHQSLRGTGQRFGLPVDPSVNVGSIAGGSGVTLVPDACTLSFDRQFLPGEDQSAAITEIEQIFHSVCAQYDLTGQLTLDQSFPSWSIDPQSPEVRDLTAAHTQASNSPAQTSIFRAYVEIELLHRAGIPGAIYGPGSIIQAHRPDEYVPLSEVATATRTYALATAAFLR